MKYKKGDTIEGLVVSITNYGVFVKLKDDFIGLVHISEITPDYVQSVNHYVKIGDKVSAKVLDVDIEKKQINLSFKQMDSELKPKYKNKIFDTKHGFSTLKDQIPVWIEQKQQDIAKNKS